MNKFCASFVSFSIMCLGLVIGFPAYAQATRTWVSGVGDDANPCSRTAPCKTFAGAISKTAARGEINVIDSGGFGAVTITKSIIIDGNGAHASILSSGTNGVVVNAGVNDIVVIRNLSINGAGNGAPTGLNGIRFLAGKELHVENVIIQNLLQRGIDVQCTTPSCQLFVRDSIIRNAAAAVTGGGILVKPGVGSSAVASLDNVRFDKNTFGLRIEDNTKAFVRNSIASNSVTGNGFVVVTASAPADLFIENCFSFGNDNSGITTSGINSRAYISNSSFSNNVVAGINPLSNSQIISFGNNRNTNTPPGGPTSTVGFQ